MNIKNIALAFLMLMCLGGSAIAQKVSKKSMMLNDRHFWIQQMDKMVRPVLQNLANDSLRIAMPKVTSVHVDNKEHRIKVQYVEVLGRVLSGIAPWLQLDGGAAEEVALRKQYREWALRGLKNALDSNAKDFMNFDIGGQQLVDASYVALAVVRAPWLWENLDQKNQTLLMKSIVTTRKFKPVFSNWLLFSAMNEAFLAKFGYDWDPMRVDYALQQMEQWYTGDGMYTDGTSFAFDYYNSYVIHPYLAALSEIIGKKTNAYKDMFEKIKKRNERYAIIQERLINADGTYPATGRSIIYRGAAFHHLADMALRKALPKQLSAEQVRCALTAVIRKTLESPTTYKNGWLTIGLYGEQPELGDFYNNQGSPYIASNIFLPLGLPASDPFWANPPAKWSAQKIWSGENFKNDHSENLK
ncbi:DUF2264 domain-containing protein [Pedobacter sp. GR22-10]|uniref:DUF2264 domain-containing protein n=1 Tax=Pedobacter sp. GR22-10 TaxID=2994472 RepID=UPI002246575B|nr:DUF2264 domain-containing protein [Pedobacter sp. GR22-10]MCX2432555.1 DUF2264 domain-containing protein [Pedobacter sp. GR22-10]